MRRLQVGCIGKAAAVAISLATLVGCFNQSRVIEQDSLPYKIVGSSDPQKIAMQSRFDKAGVKVITMGQDYMLSVQSQILFPNESPRLLWGSYALLNDIVCYLKQFRKISVTVTAYSNKCSSSRREQSLTLARARAVANYLWSQGIDSRFIFTQGLGSDKPISTYLEKGDKSPNSRIEIVFHEAIA